MNLKIFSDGQHMKNSMTVISQNSCFNKGFKVLCWKWFAASPIFVVKNCANLFFPGYPQMTLASYTYVSWLLGEQWAPGYDMKQY
jgi:hypothetical protein